MEKDLHALESDLANSVKKQDLNSIKNKWGLKSETYGSTITAQAARQALANELRQDIRSLQSRHGGAASQTAVPGAILSAVADSQEFSSPRSAVNPGSQRSFLGLAICGGAALAAFAFSQQSVQPQKVAAEDPSLPRDQQSRPSHSAASANETVPIVEGKRKGLGASGDRETQSAPVIGKKEDMPKPATNQAPNPRQSETQAKTMGLDAAGKTSGTELAMDMKVIAAVSLVVIGLGFWWIWRQPPGGPPVLDSTEQVDKLDMPMPDMPSSKGAALGQTDSFIRARQAGEVIFENAPKDGQVWDMSASVRGIQGGVQEKITKFQR